MRLIAIIPARKGSKRLPNKNFKEFFGKRIISYPLVECVASEIFDKIVISTDDPEYGESSLVQVHKRPPELADDKTTIDEVVYHLLTTDFQGYDYVCVIYPTAYAVTWQDLCKAFSHMLINKKDYCCSYGMMNEEWDAKALPEMLSRKYEYEIDNGGFYWVKVESFIQSKSLISKKSPELYELPMVDINTIQDFAEAKIHALSLGERFKW